jgi:hypothetical protein
MTVMYRIQQHPKLAARLLLPPLQQAAGACKQTAFPLYRATGVASKRLPAASAAAYDAIHAQQEFTTIS